MSAITHHLTPELLMAYAAGTLPEAFSLIVATHISMCDECRAALGAYEEIGGEVLDGVGSADMAQGSFDAVMTRLDTVPEADQIRPHMPNDFPNPLVEYVRSPAHVAWRKLGGGVKQAILPTSRNATARLLYIPGGVAVPDHGHRGTELTLVLSGAFQDEEGRYGPGDIEIANEELDHSPIAEPGAPCICLAATDAPLRFHALMPRILQPFFRI